MDLRSSNCSACTYTPVPEYRFLAKGGLFRLSFGPKSFIIISDPIIAKYVLRENPLSFDKGILAEILEPIMGKGLIPADLETWKERRRAIVPAFHTAYLNAMVNMFVSCTNRTVQKIEAGTSEGKPMRLNMEDEFLSLGLDIIGLGVFNYDFGSVTKESPVIKAVYRCLREAVPIILKSPVLQLGTCFVGLASKCYFLNNVSMRSVQHITVFLSRFLIVNIERNFGLLKLTQPQSSTYMWRTGRIVVVYFAMTLPSVRNQWRVIPQDTCDKLVLQEHRSTFYLPYWNIPLSDVFVPRLRDFKANMAVLDQQLDELIRLAVNTKQEDDIESLQARVFPQILTTPRRYLCAKRSMGCQIGHHMHAISAISFQTALGMESC